MAYVSIQKGEMADAHLYATFFRHPKRCPAAPCPDLFRRRIPSAAKNIFTFFHTPYNKRGNEPLNLQY